MAKSPSALLLLAEGAEEIEVVMPVDFLRRAGVIYYTLVILFSFAYYYYLNK